MPSLNTGNAILSNAITVDGSYNVGIGTSSPGGILDVQKNQNATTNFYLRNTNTVDSSSRAFLNIVSGNVTTALQAINNDHSYLNCTNNLYFQTGGGTRAVITSAGNVGIGTTSPRSTSGYTFLAINGSTKGGYLDLYYNGTQTGAIGAESNGLNITGIGTSLPIIFNVNNAGTYIEPMRITSTGYVGVGSTSPNAPLDVTSATSSSSAIQQWSYNSAPSGYRLQLNTIVSSGLVKYSFDLLNNSTAYTNNLVLTNGNVLIGTTTDNGYKLNVNGAISTSFTRYTGNSDFYIGVGSAISGAFGGNDFVIWNSANAGGTLVLNGSPIAGVVLPKGATSWSSYSDERMKTDIEDIYDSIDKLMSLRTIKYHLKDVDTETDKKRYGLIAQDLIGKFDEILDVDNKEFYQVRYTELIPVLVKAIQELNQTIQNQQQQINQLINK